MNKAIASLVLSVGISLFSCGEKKSSGTEVAAENKEVTTVATYQNPVIPGDFADPSIIRVGDLYYAVGTSSEWAPYFPIFKSNDMINWKQTGYVFQEKPEWTSSSFWAPELYYHNNTYYVYYVARRKSDGVSVIGVATSKNPEEGFTDHGMLIEHDKEAIDPFVINDNGQLYISWKAYGLDPRPIELLGSKLSADGLKLEGEPFFMLKDVNLRGIEGQYLMKKDGFYYLFYSEGACCGGGCDYDVRVARAKSIKGPYELHEKNPILKENSEWKCPGHGTMVETPAGKHFYMYHAYSQHDDIYTGRQGLIDEVFWDKNTGWPYFENEGTPSTTASLSANNITQETSYNISDDFEAEERSLFWQWDFRNSQPEILLEEGHLCLSGVTEAKNNAGTALTVRPYLGTYEMKTEVVASSPSLKGLVLYGDVSQAVGIGVENEEVQLWEVKDNKRKVLAKSNVAAATPVQLKMTVEDGSKITFFWSQDNNTWTEIKEAEGIIYDGSFLPQWDRSPRPGLIHYGKTTEPACFSFFELTYGEN